MILTNQYKVVCGCGKEFTAYTKRAKHCSDRCRKKASSAEYQAKAALRRKQKEAYRKRARELKAAAAPPAIVPKSVTDAVWTQITKRPPRKSLAARIADKEQATKQAVAPAPPKVNYYQLLHEKARRFAGCKPEDCYDDD